MDEQKHRTNHLNSVMVQSYFDGELKSEELEAISHEALVSCDEYRALEELRQVVRTESELALDGIDGFSLLDAINQQIDSETKRVSQEVPVLNPLSQPKRRTSRQFFQRWAPAMIGAALFLLSIPGLVHWVAGNSSEPQQQPQTVVVIDSNSAQHPQNMVNYQMPVQIQAAGQNANDQLTVEEMDFAIRHLIRRIEMLEDARQKGANSPQVIKGSLGTNGGNL